MAIRNNDGTIFRLNKPNPLLKTQDVTNDDHIVHNFSVQEFLIHYTKKKKLLSPNGAVVSTPTLPPALEQQPQLPVSNEPKLIQIPETPSPEVVSETPTPPVEKEDDYMEDNEAALQDTVSCWCLPGEYRHHVDNLYGETRRNLVWKDKFMFEGVIIQGTEMMFVIWTQIKITPPSIIYIRSQRRWWRVTEVNPHDNGFAMSCLPSESRPSFD